MFLSNMHSIFQAGQQRLGIRVVIGNIRVIEYLIEHDVNWKSGYAAEHQKKGCITCGFVHGRIVGECEGLDLLWPLVLCFQGE